MSDNLFPIHEARRLRAAKAYTLDRLEDGSLDLEAVLRKPPRALRNTTLYDILVATKSLGPTGAKTTLEGAGLWPMLSLGEISSTARERIIENLPPRFRS